MLYEFNRDGSPVKCPCNGCQERSATCHADCKKYAKFKEELNAYNEKKRAEDERYIISDTKRKWLEGKQR